MKPPTASLPLPALAQATGAPDWLSLDHQLCFALYAASLAMTKTYKPLLAPLGLTYPQYLVMLVLWEDDGLTVSQLGDRLALDSGTLTPLLKRLASLGLLQRQRDALDERRVRLQLTDTGRALRNAALAVPQAIACATACDLQQISALAAQLTALRHQLAAAGNVQDSALAAPAALPVSAAADVGSPSPRPEPGLSTPDPKDPP